MKVGLATTALFKGSVAEQASGVLTAAGMAPSFILVCLPTGQQLKRHPALREKKLPALVKLTLLNRVGLGLLSLAVDWTPTFVYKILLRSRLPKASVPIYFARGINSGKAAGALMREEPDVVFVSGCGMIDRWTCETFHHRLVNFHLGKLPRYRGMGNIAWQVLDGERSLTATFHFIAPGPDTGDVILEEELRIPDHTKDVDAILKWGVAAGLKALPRALAKLEEPGFTARRQTTQRTTRYTPHPFLRHLAEKRLTGAASR